MRFTLLFIISLSWLLTEPAFAQDSVKSSRNFMRDLPEVTLRSLVKANNDSIIMMVEYSGRKCLFKTPYDELARQEALKEINIALKDSVVDFSVWNKPKYLAANTARDEDYLTSERSSAT